jgi:hypothetical protein
MESTGAQKKDSIIQIYYYQDKTRKKKWDQSGKSSMHKFYLSI